MKITRQHIREATGNAAFARGREYFERGRVVRLKASGSGATINIRAETLGNSQHAYVQDVQLERLPYTVDIDGECSCPVGYNCKHIAAVCLSYHSAPQGSEESASGGKNVLQRWLREFAESQRKDSEVATKRAEFVAYVLTPESAGYAGEAESIAIETRVVKHKKNGTGLTKGRHLELFSLRYDHLAVASATPRDRDIARLLSAGADGLRGGLLQGQLGYLALQHLVESGCCFWVSTDNPPLRAGAARPLHMRWASSRDDDMLELELGVADDALLLPTEPPSYLDPLRGEIGDVDAGGLTRAHIELLERAPLVQAEDAEAFSTELVKSCPEVRMPLPTALAIREIEAHAPTPRIVLGADNFDGVTQHVVWIEFGYAGVNVPALPMNAVHISSSDGDMVRIARNTDAERECLDQLAALGFELLRSPIDNQPVLPAACIANGASAYENAGLWSRFISEHRDALTAQGWQVSVADSFLLSFEAGDVAGEFAHDTDNPDWFALGFELKVGEQTLPLLDAIAPLLDSDWSQLPDPVTIALDDYRFVDIPADRLRPVLDTLRALFEGSGRVPDEHIKLSRYDAMALNSFDEHGVTLRGGELLQSLGRRLADFNGIEAVAVPEEFHAELRDYQQLGLNWLQFLRAYDFNGVLADDMGLGKTVQTLAHLLIEKQAGRLDRPALLVAPTSLMGNWQREAARFAPDLRVIVLHGSDRFRHFAQIGKADLVLTTYALVPRDANELLREHFHTVILDEAQMVKNPRSKSAQMVRQLHSDHRLCLTGTPMENHLGELWALFDFLMPGFLGDENTFKRCYRTPIERHGDDDQRERLAQRVQPFMLRRTKHEVASELPPKTEIVQMATFEPEQAELYESIRVAMNDKVRAAIARQGMDRSHITILDALLKLRQTCCDPRLLSLESAADVHSSAKFELLFDMLPAQLDEGRRILVFSQFTSMLALIEAELDVRGIDYTLLTGSTRDRDAAIERFRSGEVSLFLISLKAGGVGLNLSEADTVIHYDPWWNPAVEDQATDRAHRIGQQQPVFVYKLIVENSVEEKLLALQAHKRQLAQGIYGQTEGGASLTFDAQQLEELLGPL
jgi:superfamily II DNA or RNA helicase